MQADFIQHADGRAFIRTGHCDGCITTTPGYCCTFLSFNLERPLSADEAHWASLHEGVSVSGSTLTLSIPCSALTAEGRCSLYGLPSRPEMCVRAPELPGQVPDCCSYILTEVTK